jgi:hypothetical protein
LKKHERSLSLQAFEGSITFGTLTVSNTQQYKRLPARYAGNLALDRDDAESVGTPPEFVGWWRIPSAYDLHEERVLGARTGDAHPQRQACCLGLSRQLSESSANQMGDDRNLDTSIAVENSDRTFASIDTEQSPLQFMAKVENYGAQGTWYLIVDRAGIVDS